MPTEKLKKLLSEPLTKQIIAGVIAFLILLVAYYGSYLPWKKSRVFISTLRDLDKYQSVEEVKAAFGAVFAIPSPVGQEELVRHFGNIVLGTAQQAGKENPAVTEDLLSYLEENFEPILAAGHGMSFNQNLYLLGAINQLAFTQTGKPQYLERAKELFLKGVENGPKRPQSLYGLFEAYLLGNEKDKAIETAKRILELWPADERTKSVLDKLEALPEEKVGQ